MTEKVTLGNETWLEGRDTNRGNGLVREGRYALNRKSVNLLIVIGIVTLATVHLLFSIPAPLPWMQAVWGAGDLITYIGTIVLGIVAFAQNAQANEMNCRLMLLEESKHRLETRPFVFVSDWNVEVFRERKVLSRSEAKETICVDVGIEFDNPDKEIVAVELLLTNTTQTCLSAQYDGIRFVGSDADVGWKHSYKALDNFKIVLNPGQVGRFAFLGTQELFERTFSQKRICLSFILENRFGERYREDFDATILFRGSQPSHDKPSLFIDASNYKIGKFHYESGKAELKWE